MTSERRTKAELLEDLVELEVEGDRLRFELEDERASREHLRIVLDRADAEILFLRSIVNGLVPESLTTGGAR